MTNEELAIEIQAGKAEYGELWEQVYRFVMKQANRYFSLYGGLCAGAGVELDDLFQCGFLALRDAVQAFDPARGYTLLTFMKYPLLKHFRQVCGIRTVRRDPLNSCASLDKPIEEDEGSSLMDFVPDHGASLLMDGVIEREYQAELHNALDAAMDTLDEPKREVIRRRYWQGNTLDAIAAGMGISRENVRQEEAGAMRRLRRAECVKLLQPYFDEIRCTNAWRGTGWQAWNNTGASSVERTAEKLDAIEKRAGF